MGYSRFSFMLAVLATHLLEYPLAGRVGVYGFYILSGFLITLVCNEIYADTLKGRALFLGNRILRIYPTYWVCFAVGVVCYHLGGQAATELCMGCAVPNTPATWLAELGLFGIMRYLDFPHWPLLNTAWTLSNELLFYLILGLATARSRWLTLACFLSALAMLYFMTTHNDIYRVNGKAFDWVYFTTHGTAHHFFLGSLLYHFRHMLKPICIQHPLALLLIAQMALYWPKAWPLGTLSSVSHIYAHTLILAYAIIAMWHTERHTTRLEQWMADVSYPMFLLHTLVTAAMVQIGMGTLQKGWVLMITGTCASLIISSLIVYGVDRPIKKLRARLRYAGSEGRNC